MVFSKASHLQVGEINIFKIELSLEPLEFLGVKKMCGPQRFFVVLNLEIFASLPGTQFSFM